MESATLLTGKQYIEISPKKVDGKSSYFWTKYSYFDGSIHFFKREFDDNDYSNSFVCLDAMVKKLIFFSLCTWGELSQKKILASIGVPSPSPSIRSSVSSNLEAGRKHELYIKTKFNDDVRFSLNKNYKDSRQIKYIRIVPSDQAIETAKKRARLLAASNPKRVT